MNLCNHLNIQTEDINRCIDDLDMYEVVLDCACCCYFLEKQKQDVIDEILHSLPDLPKRITTIKIPIYPTPQNVSYYSFNGIETIIQTLFQHSQVDDFNKLMTKKAYVKVFYEKNSLFTIPVLQLEIVFFGKLSKRVVKGFKETLNSVIALMIGAKGGIEFKYYENGAHLSRLLKIPLLIGFPEFKREGILLENKVSKSQIKEMNYLHTYTVSQIGLDSYSLTMPVDLFTSLKICIMSDKIEQGITDSEVNDVMHAIFGDNVGADPINDNEFDNLPF